MLRVLSSPMLCMGFTCIGDYTLSRCALVRGLQIVLIVGKTISIVGKTIRTLVCATRWSKAFDNSLIDLLVLHGATSYCIIALCAGYCTYLCFPNSLSSVPLCFHMPSSTWLSELALCASKKFINGSREAVHDIHKFPPSSVGILVPRFA